MLGYLSCLIIRNYAAYVNEYPEDKYYISSKVDAPLTFIRPAHLCYAPKIKKSMANRSLRNFLTNLDQPMPLPEKLFKLTRNLWRRIVLGQSCCGHDGEPGC